MTVPPAAAIEVVRLRDDQEEACAALAARAFFDDPIFVWIEPDAAARRHLLATMFLALTRRSHRLAVALTTAPSMLGASLWKSPELRRLSPEQLAMTGLDRLADSLSPATRDRFAAAFEPAGAALEELSPEPVWYLGVLAVEPGHQGKGIGSSLMRPLLERADRERLPVTLETGQPKNLPLYRRHGFEVSRELPPPAPGGPVIWTMKRPAR
jgi:GNAT superfamily N-acetyltransferase